MMKDKVNSAGTSKKTLQRKWHFIQDLAKASEFISWKNGEKILYENSACSTHHI
jgi:hypothetical protein